MKRFVSIIFILFVSIYCYSQAKTTDEKQIEQVLSKLSQMWTEPNGIQIAREITAKNVISIDQKGTMNREDYLKMLSMIFSSGEVVKNTHEMIKMRIIGNTAYEHGMIELKMKSGYIQKIDVLNIFVKEDEQWKFYGSLMGDVVKDIF